MGDGKIALVLDVDALANRVKMKKTPQADGEVTISKVG
jgi:chemotaxis protein histidine kinase CheA